MNLEKTKTMIKTLLEEERYINDTIMMKLLKKGSLDKLIIKIDNTMTICSCKAIVGKGYFTAEEQFLDILKNRGWQIVRKTKCLLTNDQAHDLYKPHKDKDFYEDLCKYMISGECICCSCHKNCEEPIKEMDKLKDLVRNKWGEDEMRNAMHSSDSLENVNREIKIVFN